MVSARTVAVGTASQQNVHAAQTWASPCPSGAAGRLLAVGQDHPVPAVVRWQPGDCPRTDGSRDKHQARHRLCGAPARAGRPASGPVQRGLGDTRLVGTRARVVRAPVESVGCDARRLKDGDCRDGPLSVTRLACSSAPRRTDLELVERHAERRELRVRP